MTGYDLATIVGGATTLFSNAAIQLVITFVGSLVLVGRAIRWMRSGG